MARIWVSSAMDRPILNYDDVGNGIPILLIHGFPHDRRLWQHQLSELSSIARVIAPDLRGFGASSDPPQSMSMDDHAEDLHALLEQLGVEKVVVLGLSMGGYIALAFQARYAASVKGLVLCSTRAGADSEEARAGREATAGKVMQEGVPKLAEEMMPKMLSPGYRSSGSGAVIQTMMAEQRTSGVVSALRGMAARPDRTALLASIDVPTMIIAASEDALIPSSESKAMAWAIPGSDLVIIPGATHLPNVEAPQAFNAAVLKFLSGLNGRAAPTSGG